MNRDEQRIEEAEQKAGIVFILFALLGVVYYRTGVYTWRTEDIASLTIVIVALAFFAFIFIKRRF